MRVLKMSIYAFITVLIMIAAISQNDSQENSFHKLPAKGKLADALVMYVGSNKAIFNEEEKIIDTKNRNIKPVIINDIAFIPLNFTSLILDKNIEWNQNNLEAMVTSNGRQAIFTIGSTSLVLDGHSYVLKNSPVILDKRTYIPLNAVAIAFGKKIFYNNGLIIISNTEKIFDPIKNNQEVKNLIERINYLPSIGNLNTLKKLIVYGKDLNSNKSVDIILNYGELIKHDDQYIYMIRNDELLIIKAFPAEELKIVSNIKFQKKDFKPKELLLYGNRLVVIGIRNYNNIEINRVKGLTSITSKAAIFDITNKKEIKKVREIEIGGKYVGSKISANCFYMVTNMPLSKNYVQNLKKDQYLGPIYRDTAINRYFNNFELKNIKILSNSGYSSFITIGGINMDKPIQPVEITAFLGGGNMIYFSAQNLYITANYYKSMTNIYKLHMSDGSVTFIGEGKVAGSPIVQNFMVEESGNLRIGTFRDMILDRKASIQLNVLELDNFLNIKWQINTTGKYKKAEDIVFTSNRCFIKTSNPNESLFIINLLNHAQPNYISNFDLKEFNGYFLPYDENRVIVFDNPSYKMAMYDFTVLEDPKKLFEETFHIVDGVSKVFANRNSVLLIKDKNILALPAETKKIMNDQEINKNRIYINREVFVYKFDKETGFKQMFHISHNLNESNSMTNVKNYDINIEIDKLLYANGNIYSISKGKISANDSDKLEGKGSLNLEGK
jgi:inhibitor of cysteine peptidase